MSFRILAALAAACLPCASQAQSIGDALNASCSDQLIIAGTADTTWRCTGDLSLTGLDHNGAFSAGHSINLVASGKLTLDNMRLTAPIIHLQGSEVAIGAGSVLDAGDVDVTAGSLLDIGGRVQAPAGRLVLAASGSLQPAALIRQVSDRRVINWVSLDIGDPNNASGQFVISQPGNLDVAGGATQLSQDTTASSVISGILRSGSGQVILANDKGIQLAGLSTPGGARLSQFTVAEVGAIPEPQTLHLVGAGLLTVAWVARRRRQA